MKVLMITGDKKVLEPGTEAHERFLLQRGAVEQLEAVFWGRGEGVRSMFPPLPHGEFDVVTTQDPLWRGLFGCFVAWRKRTQLNVQVHVDMRSLGRFSRLLARCTLHCADSVRVVSERIKTQVAPLTRAPITTLPVFVDLARFRAVERIPHERKTILWVGRFEDEKDPLRAIDTLREVRESGVDAQLVMLGDGALRRAAEECAAGMPVTFPGWQDPVRFLGEADVVLSTSRTESWGASIVESLAAGVPVVAPDVGVAREAGAIVVPRSKLAEAVADVLEKGARGELALSLLSQEEWVARWRDALY